MSNKSKRKSKVKKHIGNKPHFMGLEGESNPRSQGFSPHGPKGQKPVIKRTTSK